jgi:hypothetical protein
MTRLYECDKCKVVVKKVYEIIYEGRPQILPFRNRKELCSNCYNKIYNYLEKSEEDTI